MKFILARKERMTQIFDQDGRVWAGTILSAGPVTVTQVKTPEVDGYSAVQVGFDDQKVERVNKAQLGHAKGKGFKVMKEFRLRTRLMSATSLLVLKSPLIPLLLVMVLK